jgi:cytoskeletal protein CcmA (bactofilin family)
MSCPHEWQLSAYADAGLSAPEARALETHLVGCARCRRRVIALRDEARVLRDLAHERLPAPVEPARAGRGVALGLPLAVGALALVSLGASAALEALPRPIRWIAPTESLGVTRMLVNLFFAIRDNFAAWFDFAFALAALGAVAGVAYLAADLLLRRTGTGARAAALLLFASAAALAPQPAQAKFEVRQQDEVRVAAGETVEGSLVALGDHVLIEGTVRGDLLAFGDAVHIRGTIEGNVFCAGDNVELAATVTGSVHCAGQDLTASGTTAGSLYAAAEDLTLEPGARVGADLAVACEDCRVQGEVARDVLAAGESLVLEGRAGRDVSIRAKDVSFRATASYPGAIDLHMPKGHQPDIAAGATLGKTTRSMLDEHGGPATPIHRFAQAQRLRGHVVLVVAAFLVGLVLFALAPGMFDARIDSTGRFFSALLAGIVALASLIAVGVLFAVTLIGIPAAVIVFLGMAAFIFVGPIVVGAVVGRSVMRSGFGTFRDFAVALGVGHLLLGVLTGLPGIGGFALFVLVLEGTGILTIGAYEWWQERRAARLADVPA